MDENEETVTAEPEVACPLCGKILTPLNGRLLNYYNFVSYICVDCWQEKTDHEHESN